MAYTMYTYPNNHRAWKAEIAGKYVGVDIKEADGFEMGKTNKSDAFLKMNPLGKVPTLQGPDGAVWESNAIARYVARLGKNNLYGRNALEAAQIDQWIDFSVGEIELPGAAWLYPILGYIPPNAVAQKRAAADLRKVLDIFNKHLTSRTYLVGETITLADIVVACALSKLYTMVFDAGFRKQFTNTNRWFNTCINQPNFKAVMGELKLCEKMMVAQAAPAAAKKEKEAPAKKEASAKKETPAKKDDAPAAAADAEEPKPKAKNPLDLLPKSTFDLEEWKRVYSNQDTRKEALPWLWKNVDLDGFAFWFCDYKYSDELSKVFMTCNLAGGFVARLESLRKYGFGQLVIFGDDEKGQHIGGCFLTRGKDEMPFELRDCPDWESYEWRKADPEKDRALIENYFAWDGDFSSTKAGALTVNQGKQFK